MKKLFTLFALVVIYANAYAQFEVPKQKDAISLKSRTLLVKLKSVDDDYIKRNFKKDPEGGEDYRKRAEAFNETLKQYISKYWKLNTTIEFKTFEEINALLKQDEDKYAVLRFGYTTKIIRSTMNREMEVYSCGVTLGDKDKEMFSVSFPNSQISEADLIFIIHQFNKYVEAGVKDLSDRDTSLYNPEKNLGILEKKTLYMTKESLALEESEIKTSYPYPYKLVASGDIEDAVKKGDENVAYPSVIWSDRKVNYVYVLIDAATSDVLSVAGMGGFEFAFVGKDEAKSDQFKKVYFPIFSFRSRIEIKSSHLKYWVSKGAMKFNY